MRAERDLDGQATGRHGLRGDGDCGCVGGGDGSDDGQAETVAAVTAGRARAEPLEGLEQAVDLGGGDGRPRVRHGQDSATAVGPGSDAEIPGRDVVPDSVVDQVVTNC